MELGAPLRHTAGYPGEAAAVVPHMPGDQAGDMALDSGEVAAENVR
jgi:hypothetical protein